MIEKEDLVHYAPYPEGPKAQKIEKSEFNKMLEMKVFEPVETELLALIM